MKYFRDWPQQGHRPIATKPVRAAYIEPPQISRQMDIPAQHTYTSSLSIGEEASPKHTAYPSVLTGSYDFVPSNPVAPTSASVLADLRKLFKRIQAPAQDHPISTPLVPSSHQSRQEKNLLEQLELSEVDEGPRQTDFVQVMEAAGAILHTPFLTAPQSQVNPHMATLHRSAPKKQECSVSFPEEFNT